VSSVESMTAGPVTQARAVVRNFCLSILILSAGSAVAQPARRLEAGPSNRASTFRLDIRILISPTARARVTAQEWSRLFQRFGRAATIVSDTGREIPGVRIVEGSGKSQVKIVGLMDRSGAVVFRDRRFRLTDDRELQKYLENLAAHGPEGPVRLRPTWGLSDEQFQEVLRRLAVPVTQEVQLRSAIEAVESLNLPDDFRVTWTESARRLALSADESSEGSDLGSLSTGSSLAIVLAQFGLGFRPMEHPRGGYVIEIDTGDEESNLWPVGWKNSRPLTQVAPILFKSIPVDLQDVEIDALISVLADRIKMRPFYARQTLHEKGIDVTRIVYSRKPDRISPSRLMHLIGRRHGMGLDVRTDEAGQLFLWCTTAEEHAAWKKRFAHVIPGNSQ